MPIIDVVGRHGSPPYVIGGNDAVQLETRATVGDACRLDRPPDRLHADKRDRVETYPTPILLVLHG